MPRRAEIQPRTVAPDPVYGSVLVTQLVNRLMSDGKKSIAERVVYDALTQVADKTGKPALEALDAAGLPWRLAYVSRTLAAVETIAAERGFPPEQVRKELYWPKGRQH